MDVNVKSMNWTSCSKMSRVFVLLYSVGLNNKIVGFYLVSFSSVAKVLASKTRTFITVLGLL